MKKLAVLTTAVIAMSLSADIMAQTRGPRYNPGGGSPRPSGPSSSSGSPRGPSYNPGGSSSSSSSRPSSSSSSSSSRPSPSPSRPSSSSSSTPRGPSYNPSPSRPSPSPSTTPRGPSYNPSPSRPSPSPSTTPSRPTPSTPSTSTTPRGPRYNPSPDPTPSRPAPGPVVVTPTRPTPGTVHVPRGPRYNPPGPSTPAPHRDGHVLVRRTIYRHVPHSVTRTVFIYHSPRDYHLHVSRHYIYRRWIQEPVIWTYTDGYWDIDGYPYYVDNGYRYRYNPVESCKYDLVDGNDYSVVNQFQGACNEAYDRCAVAMDDLNRPINTDRYFCAESVDDDLVVEDTT